MKNVLQLIRVSTEAQAGSDRASLASQRTINQRTAQTYGLTIVKTIEIVDVSGAAVLLSSEMQELLRLIADREIVGVVTREFSRLMRPENFSDYALLQAFAETGTLLYLPDGPIDFSSDTGRLIGAVRAWQAGTERTDMLKKTWAAKESKRRAGGFAQGRICLPHGVTFDGAKWSYTPEAEAVKIAFHLVLAGELNYYELSRQVGIPPFNLRVILRNPIYTGWRVIDKKRDPSIKAHQSKANGKQKDRPKIPRTPDEIIRYRAIEPGLITESEFARAQELMGLKRMRHWSNQPGYEHRFTYNGFLTCSSCGLFVQTSWSRDDYYVCKGRRVVGEKCQSKYMRRDVLDPELDSMFAAKFTDRDFLIEIAKKWASKQSSNDSATKHARLESQSAALRSKRQRVLDGYFEGLIDRTERDRRLAAIDSDLSAVTGLLMSEAPTPVGLEALVSIFEVFADWDRLEREDKRRILPAVVPEIKVADYRVEGVFLAGCSNGINPTAAVLPIATRLFIPIGLELR